MDLTQPKKREQACFSHQLLARFLPSPFNTVLETYHWGRFDSTKEERTSPSPSPIPPMPPILPSKQVTDLQSRKHHHLLLCAVNLFRDQRPFGLFIDLVDADWVILKHTQRRLINQIGSYWNTHGEDLSIRLGHTETRTEKTYQSDWVILKHTQGRLINQIGSYWNTHSEDLSINQVFTHTHTHTHTHTRLTNQTAHVETHNRKRLLHWPHHHKTHKDVSTNQIIPKQSKHRRLFSQLGQTKTKTYKCKTFLNHPVILKHRMWNIEDFKPHWNTQQKIKQLDCAVTCKHKKLHKVWPQRKTKMQK